MALAPAALAVVATAGSAGCATARPVSDRATVANPSPRASGVVGAGADSLSIDLFVEGDVAELRVHRAGGGKEQRFLVTEPESALLILADQRLSFLWPALLEWAGPSLAPLRARALADARQRWTQGWSEPPRSLSDSLVRPQTRGLLQYTRALWLLGQRDEANGMLRTTLAGNGRQTDWQRAEYAMVSLRLASQLFEGGDELDATDTYVEMERALAGTGYAINATVNRAANAAEQGRYADGLALIDKAFAAFQAVGGKAQPKTDKGQAVPGSLREFAWIKACALHGLGRTAEAASWLAPALAEPEPRGNGLNLTSNASIRVRAFLCMHDADAVAAEMVKRIADAPLSPRELLTLQPGFFRANWDAATLARVRADPRIKAALTGRMRVLPPELAPALNRWAPAR